MAAKKKTKKKSKSRVNEAGNYTKPTMRKRLFNKIKAGTKGGKAGQWSAREGVHQVRRKGATANHAGETAFYRHALFAGAKCRRAI